MTYGEVAAAAGRPGAARAVGNILNKNYDQSIPCHRVVRSDGTPGGYNRGLQRKVLKLKTEGVKVGYLKGRGRVNRAASKRYKEAQVFVRIKPE